MKRNHSFEDREIADETESGSVLPVRIMKKLSSKLLTDKGNVREKDTSY